MYQIVLVHRIITNSQSYVTSLETYMTSSVQLYAHSIIVAYLAEQKGRWNVSSPLSSCFLLHSNISAPLALILLIVHQCAGNWDRLSIFAPLCRPGGQLSQCQRPTSHSFVHTQTNSCSYNNQRFLSRVAGYCLVIVAMETDHTQ